MFEDTKDQPHHLIITSKHDSNKPKITSKLKNNNNNKNNSNNKSKLLKIKSKSSSSSSSTNANLSIATNKSLSVSDHFFNILMFIIIIEKKFYCYYCEFFMNDNGLEYFSS